MLSARIHAPHAMTSTAPRDEFRPPGTATALEESRPDQRPPGGGSLLKGCEAWLAIELAPVNHRLHLIMPRAVRVASALGSVSSLIGCQCTGRVAAPPNGLRWVTTATEARIGGRTAKLRGAVLGAEGGERRLAARGLLSVGHVNGTRLAADKAAERARSGGGG